MNLLDFRFEREDDWHGKLIANVSVAGFTAQGGAWFNTGELRRFAENLSTFPLGEEALPYIAGGFGVEADPPEQIHLAVSLAPHNARGAIRVTVQLATEVRHDEANDLACSATVRFKVTYGDLARFGPDFINLLDGRSASATLQSSAE
jgi:hypothetical protein